MQNEPNNPALLLTGGQTVAFSNSAPPRPWKAKKAKSVWYTASKVQLAMAAAKQVMPPIRAAHVVYKRKKQRCYAGEGHAR